MTYSFKNKVAIVTGSNRGLGKALALALLRQGARVVLNGRDAAKLEETRREFLEAGFACLTQAGDVSDYAFCEQMVKATIEKFGQLDIMINNAGLSSEGKLEETAPEVFRKSFEVNALGVIYPTKAAIPYLKESKGSIIFTGSIAGFMGLPEFSAYSGSKMALTAITQALRIELDGTGVHVGLNYVGFVENENSKTYINKEGKVEPLPVRASFTRMPREKVAAIFLRGIARRKKVQVLSGLGKITWWLSRWLPGLFEFLMTSRYRKKQTS